MIGALLARGLVAGLLAGLAAGTVALAAAEPAVDRAIAFEEAAAAHASGDAGETHAAAGAAPDAADEPLVSRGAQRAGLVVATSLYGAAAGVLLALAFAALRGRARSRSDWTLAVSLAALAFMAAVLVPFLKYPANPPAVGDPDTIGERTALYFTMVAVSLLGALAAWRVARRVPDRAEPWPRPLAAAATFAATVGGAALALPAVDEVPAGFPADLLWDFRLASLGTQLALWSGLGLLFGAACSRLGRERSGAGGGAEPLAGEARGAP